MFKLFYNYELFNVIIHNLLLFVYNDPKLSYCGELDPYGGALL